MNVIYDLMDYRAEHNAKMSHKIPDVPVVERERFLLERAKGKVVLDIGASGPMSEALRRVAREWYGIDSLPNPGTVNYFQVDIDRAKKLPEIPGVGLVIAGEVIEHLSNPGHFLEMLAQYYCPIILTTPNAFSEVGYRQAQRGIESVNPEHVAWYSWHTLKVLVERHGYSIKEWYWYKGKPITAEGMVFCMESE